MWQWSVQRMLTQPWQECLDNKSKQHMRRAQECKHTTYMLATTDVQTRNVLSFLRSAGCTQT